MIVRKDRGVPDSVFVIFSKGLLYGGFSIDLDRMPPTEFLLDELAYFLEDYEIDSKLVESNPDDLYITFEKDGFERGLTIDMKDSRSIVI